MSEFHVDQEVILRTPGTKYHEPKDESVTVARIGRKYVYVKRNGFESEYAHWGKPTAFDKVTGREVGIQNGAQVIGAAEMFARQDEQAAAVKRVRELTRSFGWPDRMSPEALTKIADLIEAEVIEP